MPPHCDTLDGPIVQAAQTALDTNDVKVVLPYVKSEHEDEVTSVFKKVVSTRTYGGTAKEIADRYFFETVVRLHRAGEGAPYTGLKPAGLSVGPIIPIAEKAVASGSFDQLADTLSEHLRTTLQHKASHLAHLKMHAQHDTRSARAYVEAMLGVQVWSHGLYQAMMSNPHERAATHTHE